MPDIVSVLERRWKWMLMLTLLATAGAFLASLLSSKKYLSVVTALPSNAALTDKARIFNQNIEALYPEFGSPDELDKIEGTAKLDTIFLAAAKEFGLSAHYELQQDSTAYKAAVALRKNTRINRTGFGELKIGVWDKDKQLAAALANALLQKLNDIHQQLKTENMQLILQRLKEEYRLKEQALPDAEKGVASYNKDSNSIANTFTRTDSASQQSKAPSFKTSSANALKVQLAQYATLITEYDLAVKTAPKALLVVEPARPSPEADKPKVVQTVLFTFLASLLTTFLLAVFAERGKKNA